MGHDRSAHESPGPIRGAARALRRSGGPGPRGRNHSPPVSRSPAAGTSRTTVRRRRTPPAWSLWTTASRHCAGSRRRATTGWRPSARPPRSASTPGSPRSRKRCTGSPTTGCRGAAGARSTNAPPRPVRHWATPYWKPPTVTTSHGPIGCANAVMTRRSPPQRARSASPGPTATSPAVGAAGGASSAAGPLPTAVAM